MSTRLILRSLFAVAAIAGFTVSGSVMPNPAHAAGSTLLVNTASDLTTCKPPGDGALSLHCAIADANSDYAGSGLSDTIEFQISSSASTIVLSSVLPSLTASGVTIDGYTGNTDGSTPNSNKLANGDNAVIGVTVYGADLSNSPTGIYVFGSNDTITGLNLTGFDVGVLLAGNFGGAPSTGDKIQGCFIGNVHNFLFTAGNTYGVEVTSANHGALIGGTTAAQANVISRNSTYGVWSTFTKSTIVEGNYIGTTPNGAAAANNGTGVFIVADTGTDVIGAKFAGNVISGNNGWGIAIEPYPSSPPTADTGGMIQGNVIGANADQSAAIGNGSGGIFTEDNSGLTVGGTDPNVGNYILGNAGPGLYLTESSGETVQGNFIGYTSAGNAMGNQGDGIKVDEGSTSDTIGGSSGGNEIANNVGYGVDLGNSSSDSVHVHVTLNSMFANSYGGISLNGQDQLLCTLGLAYVQNAVPDDYTPCPLILAATPDKIVGEACTGCTVEIYVAPGPFDVEGETLLGTLTAGTCPAGAKCQNFTPWTLKKANYSQTLHVGDHIVATATSTVEPYYPQPSPPLAYAPQTSSFSRDVPVGQTLVVNTTSDASSPCTPSQCSLRAALTLANTEGKGDEIDFNIPSGECSPKCVIGPHTPLPVLTAPSTFINAYTQTGASPNTNTTLGPGDNATITVEITGAGISGVSNGFTFHNSYDSAEGLAVGKFNGDGFEMGGQTTGSALFDIVAGCFIGNLDGATFAPNLNGVDIESRGEFETVGGRAFMDDNDIAGNRNYGIQSTGLGANTFRENLIGVRADDKARLTNGYDGILLFGTELDTVGGIRPDEGNVISGNFNNGVEGLDTNQTVILGNEIGINGSSAPAYKVGNGFTGVFMYLGANNLIGDLPFGVGGNVISGNAFDGVDILAESGDAVAGNVIGYVQANGGNGVMVGSSSYVTGLSLRTRRDMQLARRIHHHATVGGETPIVSGITTNIIADNTQQGILVGQSANDSIVHVAMIANPMLDNNAGGGIRFYGGGGYCGVPLHSVNDQIQCPFINSANTALVSGVACDGCYVELFKATVTKADAGYGEGTALIGTVTATGSGAWSISLRGKGITAGTDVTATASQYIPQSYQTFGGYYLETSQFSADKPVSASTSGVTHHSTTPKLGHKVQWLKLRRLFFSRAPRAWPHYHVRFRPLKP